ncbi:uncharacterized protein N7511_004675 [Penicillium nucicola]|uniref:uncharacterized protein n=1 Tax=Penicillium nucicola TaxID=1850975 RepID=UPI0025457499|nr:uncharacterized protein N7511_004675 [Penicillium nucicola]KAJ5767059.1 hypothetical protein N7511_004675 [Penicillium nucicola]
MLSILYNIIHLLVRTCIQTFIFTHSALQPLAYAISSVLLCDMHFLKTGAAIAASFPLSSLMTTDDPNRLQYLAGPAFALGMAKALTNAAEKIVQHLLISPPEQSETETNTRVGMHILVVILAITFCVVAMIPGTIVLTVTEASLLPPGLETLIPSATKGRGMLVSELLGGCEIPSGFAGWVTIMKPYRVAQIIWLIGLHLQKCHLHVLVELVTSFILLAVIAG